MNLSPAEMKAVKAMIKYMRKDTPRNDQAEGDFPQYTDEDSFIRLADEARDDNTREIYRP